MITHALTLTLPEPVFQHLQAVAETTNRSLEEIARQSIDGNLPPDVSGAPPDMRDGLVCLQSIPVGELKKIALSRVPEERQRRHFALLEKNSKGLITPDEKQELESLRLDADRLMLEKAYAWAILRWHGEPIPPLHDLPLG